MDKITGRSDDMLIIRGVNVFPSQIEVQILAIDCLSPHYLIEVSRDGNLDNMNISVEPKTVLSADTVEAICNQLQHQVKSMIGVSSRVEMKAVGSLPRSEGKAIRVVDNR